MPRQFVSERIEPDSDSMNLADTPVGEPPVPRRFTWRAKTYEVAEILSRRRGMTQDRTHKSKEKYVAKHWFEVRTTSGHVMTIYFERQPKSKAQRTTRWWLYTVETPDEPIE